MKAVFDFKDQSIIFDDYDKFLAFSFVASGGDVCDIDRWQRNEDGTVKTDKDGNALIKLIYTSTSPVSFSCGNLVPSVLQESGNATIIGKPSGGGACVVEFAVTADGSFYLFSGRIKLSKFMNGSYYSIDTGVTPDFTISKPDHFYDREWLTEFINSLP